MHLTSITDSLYSGVGINKVYNCQDPDDVDEAGDDYSQQATINQAYAYADATAKKCDKENGDQGTEQEYGSVISTVQTAKDVEAISRKLNTDKMIRYWGEYTHPLNLRTSLTSKAFPTEHFLVIPLLSYIQLVLSEWCLTVTSIPMTTTSNCKFSSSDGICKTLT